MTEVEIKAFKLYKEKIQSAIANLIVNLSDLNTYKTQDGSTCLKKSDIAIVLKQFKKDLEGEKNG